MIEAVVFDYGGVISTPITPHLAEFEAAQGYPPGALFELLFGAGWDIEPDVAVAHDWHRLETGDLDMVTFVAGTVERSPEILGVPLDVDAFATFMAALPIGVHWPVVHRVRELRASGLRLAILTNNVREFAGTWKTTFPVSELFDVVVDSSEVGIRKPDPRVYGLTCERLGVDPEAAVFLDDLPVNVAAARAVGMEAVHVDGDIARALTDLDAILARRGTARREMRA
jgi:putative hydrolase of the HAD superfamily